MATQDNSHLPQPPFFPIPNINNLRDAALHNQPTGLTTSTGKIRPRILFRSADVSKLDRSGWEAVRSIGVNHVFDLRSKPEVIKGLAGITGANDGSDGSDVRPGWLSEMEAAGVNRSWVPVFEDSDYSPERLAERYVKYMDESDTGFVEAYLDILSHAADSYRTIMLYLANLPPPGQEKGDGPLGALVHCSAGKDRTGIFFGLLFSFLGVPREIIAEEYNLTELGLQGVRGDISSRLLQSPVFKRYALSKMKGVPFTSVTMDEITSTNSLNVEDVEIPAEIIETGRQAALRMVGARKQSMLLSLDMIDKTWGGPEKYMRDVLGLGDKELEALKRNLVVSN